MFPTQSAPCCHLEVDTFHIQEGRDGGKEDRGAQNIQHVLFINEHQGEDNSSTHTNTHNTRTLNLISPAF